MMKSAPHILDLEMLRDQLAHDRDVLRDELDTLSADAPQHARTFGAWCATRDALGRVEAMVAGWRDDVPQSLKAETLINAAGGEWAEWEECRECSDFIDPDADGVVEVLLDDNGPGEPPSRDGYVCPACNEKAEHEARLAEEREQERWAAVCEAEHNAIVAELEADELDE